ncbi:MAG TPA: trehalase family glycosidase [Opitutaceae bacterium]|nr:trehalase family glycosidase [Opitutaceae bacterium]
MIPPHLSRRHFLRLSAAAAGWSQLRGLARADAVSTAARTADDAAERALLRRRLAEVNGDIQAHGLRSIPGVAGGPFLTGYPYNEFYDWDLYFENLYLSYYGVWPYCFTNLREFLNRQDPDGYVNRSLIKRRDRQHFKPFLAQLVVLGGRQHPEAYATLQGNYYGRLQRYLDKWFTYDGDGNGLPTWNSADAAGTDNQWSRAGALGSFSVEGVDLASYLVRELDAMAVIAEALHLPGDARHYRAQAGHLRGLIEATFWDEADGMYYDRNERTGRLVRVKSATNFMPLFCGAASPARARRLVEQHLLNPKEFWLAYPVASYARTEPDYYQGSHHECNWRGPSWAPTNYMIFQGLRRYGLHQPATELANRLYDMALHRNPVLREYYDAETGLGLGQTRFWGFTALYYGMTFEDQADYDASALHAPARPVLTEALELKFDPAKPSA